MQAVSCVSLAGLPKMFLLVILTVGCGEVSDGSVQSSGESGETQTPGSVDDVDSDEYPVETVVIPAPVEEPEPVDAAAVYAGHCSGCHGTAGEGTEQAYQIQQPRLGYATWVVRNGRPGDPFDVAMPAYSDALLDDFTLSAVLAWLGEQPKPTTGEGLYVTYCGNCHGATGTGGIVREGIRFDARDEPEEVRFMVRGGSGSDRYNTRGSYMPAFDADELSDDELWLIIDFLRGGDGSSQPEWDVDEVE